MKMKRSEIVAAIIIVGFILFIIASGVYPALRSGPRNQCLSRLKSAARAINLYSNDFGGRFPVSEGWCDTLYDQYLVDLKHVVCTEAYLSTEDAKRLSSGPGLAVPVGIAAYAPIMGRVSQEVWDPEHTPLLFDSTTIQQSATSTYDTLAYRHVGKTANVHFMDGHGESVRSAPELPKKLWCAPGEAQKEPSEEAKARAEREAAHGHHHH